MLKLINSMSELDAEQLVSVYRQTILNQKNKPAADDSSIVLRAETDFLAYLREIFFQIKGAFYCVWIIDGCYVSAVRFEPYKDGLLLESLETKPSERRKGYAQTLILESLEMLKQADCGVVYSHIDKKNVPSIALHEKCGFAVISDTAKLINGTVSNCYCTMAYNLK